jgi:radical SAM protein with 4Fe4S-binding SPASM domain
MVPGTSGCPASQKRLSPDGLRLLGALKDEVFIGPRTLIIDITNRCNLNCVFCWYHSALRNEMFSKTVDFPAETFREIVSDCADLGVEEIILTGDGEPLLHPDAGRMIGMASRRNIGVTITTNATFGREMLRHVLKARQLIVNLSAATPGSYARVQGVGLRDRFGAVMRNLETLSRMRKKGARVPMVTLSCVVNGRNYRDVPGLFRLAERLGADEVDLKILDYVDHSAGLVLDGRSVAEFREILAGLLRDQGSSGKPVVESNLREVLDAFSDPGFIAGRQDVRSYGGKLSRAPACYMCWYQSYIKLNGDVVPCCRMESSRMGNVHANTFREIWHSDDYRKTRKTFKERFDMAKDPWRYCSFCGFMDLNGMIGRRLEKLAASGKRGGP